MTYDRHAATEAVKAANSQLQEGMADVHTWYTHQRSQIGHETPELRAEYLRALSDLDAQYEDAIERHRQLFLTSYPGQPLPVFLRRGFRAAHSLPDPAPAVLFEPIKMPQTRVVGRRGSAWRWVVWAGAGALLVTLLVSIASANFKTAEAGKAIAVASATRMVLYEVEGTAKGVDMTLQTPSGTSQRNGKAVPVTNKASGRPGILFEMQAGSFLYIAAQNNGASGTISCRITVDGVVVAENFSSGGYAIATCQGRAR